jgi:hypothetical protein
MQRSAYYSEGSKSWVRMERQEDGEWCHTSGFGSENAALKCDFSSFEDRSATRKPLFGQSGLPSFLDHADQEGHGEFPETSSKKPRRKGK